MRTAAWALLAASTYAASTQQPVDLFFAIDAPYYLAMVACAMRAAYERTTGRKYRFHVLHPPAIDLEADLRRRDVWH